MLDMPASNPLAVPASDNLLLSSSGYDSSPDPAIIVLPAMDALPAVTLPAIPEIHQPIVTVMPISTPSLSSTAAEQLKETASIEVSELA